ncbi:MAG: hypothetical protein ACI4YB_01000 [Oscillospiraceae bacterium]
MKPLFSAILETIVLVVSIFLVMLCVKLFKYQSPYINYSERYPDSVITMGEALKLVPSSTSSPEEAAIQAAKKLFGKNSEKALPFPIGKFLCIKVGERTARVLEFYFVIVFLESIICLIFGITLPCSLYRHIDPAKSIDEALVNKNYVYADDYGTYGHVGETRAGILKLLLFLLMLVITNIWCFFLPVFIAINFTIGIIMAILRLVGIKASDAIAKSDIKRAAGKSGKDTYRIIVENGHFAVSGDLHPDRKLYFKQYWNAVIAQRIFECDRDGLPYLSNDAKETITFGDENLHKRFETSLRMNKAKLMTSPDAKKTAENIENEIKNTDYLFTFVVRNGIKSEYIILSKFVRRYMLFREALNCALMLAVMKYDALGEDFDTIAWGKWDRLDLEQQYQLLNHFGSQINPPQGEESLGDSAK